MATSEVTDWPAYWLIRLEKSVSSGDYEGAAEAQQQLRRLGLEVTLRATPLPRRITASRGGSNAPR